MKRIESPLYTIAHIRAMENDLFAKYDSYAVMQNAAREMFEVISRDFPHPKPSQTVHVVLGAGNNAGDGLLVATLLQIQGFTVRAYRLFESEFSGDAGKAFAHAISENLDIQAFTPFDVGANDIIIEAIFGIGLSRPITGVSKVAIAHINACKSRFSTLTIYAVDVPAGICSDTGASLGIALSADTTVTFIGDKIGLHTADGKGCAGEVIVADLGASDKQPERVFNFDLERMKAHVENQEFVAVPDWATEDLASFEKWLKGQQ